MDAFLWFLSGVIVVYAVINLATTVKVALSSKVKVSEGLLIVRIIVAVGLMTLSYFVAPL